jgi:pimeloyl-ACP methyl ester carboxylesterase
MSGPAEDAGRVQQHELAHVDAFDHFPHPILKPFVLAAKFSPTFTAAAQPLRTKLGRQRAFGALAHADIDQLVVEWLRPALTDPRIREDLRRFTTSLKAESTVKAAARLPEFDKPALVAWSADDAFFALEDGKRLAQTLPNARFEVIADTRTFSMIDQPARLAALITEFADGRSSSVGRAA